MAFSLNGNRAKHKEEFRERQEKIALYFVNNFELANGDEIKEIKVLSFRNNHMTGYSHYTLLINGKSSATISENSITQEITGAVYKGGEFKDIVPPKNNTKLEVNIEYFED